MEIVGLLFLAIIGLAIGFPIYVLSKLTSLDLELRSVRDALERLEARNRPTLHDAPAETPHPSPIKPAVEVSRPGPAERETLLERIATPTPPPPAWPSIRPIIAEPPAKPQPYAETQPSHSPARDIESLVAANWMAVLGIAAIAIGVAFFLQYAFRKGWIGPPAQVGMGLSLAVFMVGFSQHLIRKPAYRKYAQILFSGGVVVYFLSIYAAYAFYEPRLMGFGPAFAAFVFGAAISSALAVANDAEMVSAICMLGAFAAPVLIRESAGPPSGEGAFRLYGYLALVNLWVAGLVRLKAWHSLAVISFACTWLIFFAGRPLEGTGWPVEAFAALFLVAACGMGIHTLRCISEPDSVLRRAGAGLIVGGCVAFVAASARILANEQCLGFPALMSTGVFVALLLVGFGLAIPADQESDKSQRQAFWYLAALGLLVITIGALSPSDDKLPHAGKLAFAFSVFNFLLFTVVARVISRKESGAGPASALLLANAISHGWAAYVALAGIRSWGVPAYVIWLPLPGVLMALLAWLESANQEKMPSIGVAAQAATHGFPIVALLVAFNKSDPWNHAVAWGLTAEFVVSLGVCLASRRAVAWESFRADLTMPLVLAAVFFGLAGRTFGFEAVNGVVILALIALATASIYAITAWSMLSGEGEDPLRRLVYLGIATTFITVAVPIQLKAAHITVAWAVEGAALIYAGLKANEKRARAYGIGVLLLAGGRAVVLDLLETKGIHRFLLNERMLAGGAVIAAAYGAAWMMWRWKDSLVDEERQVPAGLVAAANAFTLLFVSVDLWEYVGRQVSQSGVVSAQQLALSLFWTVYALALISVGIWVRTRPVRLFGIGLLYLSVFKVFLVDLSGLEQPYKIVSFLALGAILLAVSLLYTRFESRLQGGISPQRHRDTEAAQRGD